MLTSSLSLRSAVLAEPAPALAAYRLAPLAFEG